jgi:hypothetical protein
MINRIFNPNSPPNDLSSSEYSQKTTLELQNSNVSPLRWLYNPATTVGKNCAFNLPFAKNRQKPQPEPNAAAIPPKKSSRSDLPATLLAAPEHLVASESEMAPKKVEIEGKKKEAQPSTAEWTHSKCSLNHLNNLVSEGLLQEKNLVNWRLSEEFSSRVAESTRLVLVKDGFGGDLGALDRCTDEHRKDARILEWFGPPERNTLRPLLSCIDCVSLNGKQPKLVCLTFRCWDLPLTSTPSLL